MKKRKSGWSTWRRRSQSSAAWCREFACCGSWRLLEIQLEPLSLYEANPNVGNRSSVGISFLYPSRCILFVPDKNNPKHECISWSNSLFFIFNIEEGDVRVCGLLRKGVASEWKVKKQASRSRNVGPTGIRYIGYLKYCEDICDVKNN